MVARVGGDEFAILLVNADWNQRESLQQRLDACVIDANDGWDGAVPIRASAGMVAFDLSAEGTRTPVVDDLLSRADERMYAVKSERRNTG